jgi:hypothetical protein
VSARWRTRTGAGLASEGVKVSDLGHGFKGRMALIHDSPTQQIRPMPEKHENLAVALRTLLQSPVDLPTPPLPFT